MEFLGTYFSDLPRNLSFLALFIFLFLFSKWLKDVSTPFKINTELTDQDNLAVALTMSGYYLAVTAVFVGALAGPSKDLPSDLVTVGGYSILGLVFLNLSRVFNDKVILRKLCNNEQIAQEQNAAVGAVQMGTYLATGLVAAGAVTGTGGGVHTAIAFFVLGQLCLWIFSLIYDALTPYSIHKELESKNVAAGAALGGTFIALGIIIFNGTSLNFTGWVPSLMHFAVVNALAILFLTVIRLLMDRLVIPGDKLNREIAEDRNLGAGLLEASVAISFAIILLSVL